MKMLRWLLVALIGLYGLIELLLSVAMTATKVGALASPQLQPIAPACTWPMLLIWLATTFLLLLAALLLARGSRRALPAFGFAILTSILNQLLIDRSPAMSLVFGPRQQQMDWWLIGALFVVALAMLLVLRRERQSSGS